VLDVEYGLHGYLQRLHARFEQRCERRDAPALRGEVNLAAGKPPPPLKLDVRLDRDRVVVDSAGLMTLKGSIRCSKRATATVIVDVTRIRGANRAPVNASTGVPCSRTAADWVIEAQSPDPAMPLTAGPIDVRARAEASDDYYTSYTGEFVYARDAVAVRTNVRPADPGAAPVPKRLKVSGTWTMTSEQGDYVGRGTTLRAIPAEAITFKRTAGEVQVQSSDGEGWYIRIGAPGGARLQERRYTGVARFPESGSGRPVLDVSGAGNACGETYGSFTVHDVEYGAHDILTALHMSFVQRCDQPTAPALRGEVNLVSEPPPPPLEIDLTLDIARAAIGPSGRLAMRGSVECTRPALVYVIADVTETGRSINSVGRGEKGLVECSKTPSDWSVEATTTNGVEFTNGPMTVKASANASDQEYTYYTGDAITAVDEVSGQADVSGGRPPAGGVSAFVSREPGLSLLAGLALLLGAVAGTAFLTRVAARRWSGP
jgi:hypothetical protein